MNYWVAPCVNRKLLNSENLMKRICKHFKITEEELLSNKRTQLVVDARSILAYILHKKYGLTTTSTGEIINRDHSTVTYFTKKIEGFIEFDKDFKKKITNLMYNYN